MQIDNITEQVEELPEAPQKLIQDSSSFDLKMDGLLKALIPFVPKFNTIMGLYNTSITQMNSVISTFNTDKGDFDTKYEDITTPTTGKFDLISVKANEVAANTQITNDAKDIAVSKAAEAVISANALDQNNLVHTVASGLPNPISSMSMPASKVVAGNVRISTTTKMKMHDTILYTGRTSSQDTSKPELVVNGTNLVDTTGWLAFNNAGLSALGGNLVINANVTNYPNAYQILTTVIGLKYTVVVGKAGGEARYLKLGTTLDGSEIVHSGNIGSDYIFSFEATTTTTYLSLAISSTSDDVTSYFGGISFREAMTSLPTNDKEVYWDGSELHVGIGVDSCDLTKILNGNNIRHDRGNAFGGGALIDGSNECIMRNDANVIVPSGNMRLTKNIVHVHVKSRTNASSHIEADGLRGGDRTVYTDLNNPELIKVGSIKDFKDEYISLGTDVHCNQAGNNHIIEITVFTHIAWGINNHGKRFLVAYEPTTNQFIAMHNGSGQPSYELPHFTGSDIRKVDTKGLNLLVHWTTRFYGMDFENREYAHSNLTNVVGSDSRWSDQKPTDKVIYFDGYLYENQLNITYFSKGSGNSSIREIGIKVGTGQVDNTITLDNTPSSLKLKSFALSEWIWHAKVMNDGKGYLSTDDPAVEQVGTHPVIFNDHAVSLQSTHSYWNQSGIKYHYEITFDTNKDGGGSYADIPNENPELTAEQIQLFYTYGFVNGEAVNRSVVLDGAIVPINGWSAGRRNYLKHQKDIGYYSTIYKPQENIEGNFGERSSQGKNLRTTARHGAYEGETGVVSASGNYATFYPYKAFNKKNATGSVDSWLMNQTTGSITYNTNVPKCLESTQLTMTMDSSVVESRFPKDYTIQARMDDGAWVVLNTTVGETLKVGEKTALKESSDKDTFFNQFKIDVTQNNGDGTYLTIGDIEFNFTSPSDYQIDDVWYNKDDVKYETPITYFNLGIEVNELGNIVDVQEVVVNHKDYVGRSFTLPLFTAVRSGLYLIDYPLDGTDWKGWSAKLFIQVGKSVEMEYSDAMSDGGSRFGITKSITNKGVMISARDTWVYHSSTAYGGMGSYTENQQTSVKCRLKLKYDGESYDN